MAGKGSIGVVHRCACKGSGDVSVGEGETGDALRSVQVRGAA